MDEEIRKAYEQAPRFDEGAIYQSPECQAIGCRWIDLEEQITKALKPEIIPVFEELMTALCDESELECQHYFQQGYLAGKGAAKNSE